MTGVRHGIVAVSRPQCLSLELYPALAQLEASLDQLLISLANQCNVNLMLPHTLLKCHGTRLVLCIPRQAVLQPHEDIEQYAMRVAGTTTTHLVWTWTAMYSTIRLNLSLRADLNSCHRGDRCGAPRTLCSRQRPKPNFAHNIHGAKQLASDLSSLFRHGGLGFPQLAQRRPHHVWVDGPQLQPRYPRHIGLSMDIRTGHAPPPCAANRASVAGALRAQTRCNYAICVPVEVIEQQEILGWSQLRRAGTVGEAPRRTTHALIRVQHAQLHTKLSSSNCRERLSTATMVSACAAVCV